MKKFLRKLLPLTWMLLLTAASLYGAAMIVETYYGVAISTGQFRFERPWLGLLAPLALLVLGVRSWWRTHGQPRLNISRGLLASALGGGKRTALLPMVAALRATAVLLFVGALMGPQSIHARDRTEVEGIDIVLTLDLSLSMQATDIAPNRFEATKAVVDEFIRRRPNDRIGAVIFGRDAYTLLPLTSDHNALRNMVSELQLGLIDGRGTAIGNAVGVALNRLRRSQAKSKVVILLTDGESNSGNLSPQQTADFAKTMKVKIYSVLMGETDDARRQNGMDRFGRPIFEPGSFPINPELLQSMATTTGGEAFRASDRSGLERSFHDILNRLDRTEFEDPGRVYAELFPALLGPALLMLVIELLLSAVFLRRFP